MSFHLGHQDAENRASLQPYCHRNATVVQRLMLPYYNRFCYHFRYHFRYWKHIGQPCNIGAVRRGTSEQAQPFSGTPSHTRANTGATHSGAGPPHPHPAQRRALLRQRSGVPGWRDCHASQAAYRCAALGEHTARASEHSVPSLRTPR